jgi:hypothetical protein
MSPALARFWDEAHRQLFWAKTWKQPEKSDHQTAQPITSSQEQTHEPLKRERFCNEMASTSMKQQTVCFFRRTTSLRHRRHKRIPQFTLIATMMK